MSEPTAQPPPSHAELRKRRNELKGDLQSLLLSVQNLQSLREKLIAAMSTDGRLDKFKQKYVQLIGMIEVDVAEFVDVSYHSTLCMTHKEAVCHQHCSLSYSETSDSNIFKHCRCMGADATCHICGCGWQQHFHARKHLKKLKVTIAKLLADLKGDEEVDVTPTYVDDMAMIDRLIAAKTAEIGALCAKQKLISVQLEDSFDELSNVVEAIRANSQEKGEEIISEIVSAVKELESQTKKQSVKVEEMEEPPKDKRPVIPPGNYCSTFMALLLPLTLPVLVFAVRRFVYGYVADE